MSSPKTNLQEPEFKNDETLMGLAGQISHDFNNILGIIGMHTEALLEAANDPRQVQESATYILNAHTRAVAMLKRFHELRMSLEKKS